MSFNSSYKIHYYTNNSTFNLNFRKHIKLLFQFESINLWPIQVNFFYCCRSFCATSNKMEWTWFYIRDFFYSTVKHNWIYCPTCTNCVRRPVKCLFGLCYVSNDIFKYISSFYCRQRWLRRNWNNYCNERNESSLLDEIVKE